MRSDFFNQGDLMNAVHGFADFGQHGTPVEAGTTHVALHLCVGGVPATRTAGCRGLLTTPNRQRDHVQALIDAATSTKRKRTEAANLRQSAWTAFEAALFTAAEEPTT